MSVSLETSLAEAEGGGLTKRGGKLLDLPLCFTSCRGLGIAGTRALTILQSRRASVRSPRSSARMARLRKVRWAVDAMVNATELVGALERQDPTPADFGLARLAGLAVQERLAEMQLGVVGVDS